MSTSLVPSILRAVGDLSGARFASFVYRAKGTGELARHTVLLGVDMRALVENDLVSVNAIYSAFPVGPLQSVADTWTREAAGNILSSLAVSLVGGLGNNPAYTHGAEARGEGNQTYVQSSDLPSGVLIHRETGAIYIHCLAHTKVVLEAGEYKKVNSAPLTLAKQAVDKELRRGKIRQYALGCITGARINGETLELDTMEVGGAS